MKKLTTRTLLVALMVAASLGSYVYLNTVTPSVATPSSDETIDVQSNELKEEIQEQAKEVEVSLPDVMLLQKVIKIGKRFLPAS